MVASFSFWSKWLSVVGILIVVFGVLLTLVSGTPLFDLFSRQIDPAFWGTTPIEGAARQFQQWIYGVLGATMAGWGVFIVYVARYSFHSKEQWAWRCLALGVALWFVLDTSLSAFHQVYFNVAFNTVFFILAMLPLAFTRKEFS